MREWWLLGGLLLLAALPWTASAQPLPAGGEFRVNSYTTNFQNGGAVAMDVGGNFVVVWQSPQDGSGYGIVGQRYDAAGQPAGGEFRVNTYTTGAQRRLSSRMRQSASEICEQCS